VSWTPLLLLLLLLLLPGCWQAHVKAELLVLFPCCAQQLTERLCAQVAYGAAAVTVRTLSLQEDLC
jgi:hypothetical protein